MFGADSGQHLENGPPAAAHIHQLALPGANATREEEKSVGPVVKEGTLQ